MSRGLPRTVRGRCTVAPVLYFPSPLLLCLRFPLPRSSPALSPRGEQHKPGLTLHHFRLGLLLHTLDPTTKRVRWLSRMLHKNQFAVTKSLGRTLYGDVWLCEDALHDNQLVAVKEVNLRQAKRALSANHRMDNPFDERRFAGYLADLPHHNDHILRFQQEFLENGAWYMVTEYCEGGDLLGRLEQSSDHRLPENDALHYFRQVLEGVRYLHDNGIAHRDLSLENVLLRNDVCKIADFGLATEANRVCCERVGKAYYMAPEVIAEEDYDPMAADMWSLGIMLFIMLTGSPLVPCASRNEKAFLAVEKFGVQKILEVWGMTSSLSPGVVDLLSRLLQVSPVKRPTVEDVMEHPTLAVL